MGSGLRSIIEEQEMLIEAEIKAKQQHTTRNLGLGSIFFCDNFKSAAISGIL